jgi:hypothetical protein
MGNDMRWIKIVPGQGTLSAENFELIELTADNILDLFPAQSSFFSWQRTATLQLYKLNNQWMLEKKGVYYYLAEKYVGLFAKNNIALCCQPNDGKKYHIQNKFEQVEALLLYEDNQKALLTLNNELVFAGIAGTRNGNELSTRLSTLVADDAKPQESSFQQKDAFITKHNTTAQTIKRVVLGFLIGTLVVAAVVASATLGQAVTGNLIAWGLMSLGFGAIGGTLVCAGCGFWKKGYQRPSDDTINALKDDYMNIVKESVTAVVNGTKGYLSPRTNTFFSHL